MDAEGPRVNLKWITPNIEETIVEIARVSSDPNQAPRSGVKLLKYLMKKKHWSPFQMANMCVEVWCTRDISRQILRHTSLNFQEFSQRYQDVSVIQEECIYREARMQDHANRQNSLPNTDEKIDEAWKSAQREAWNVCFILYQQALRMGIAKEQARALLPEGLTLSRVIINGTIRSWIHYCQTRTDPSTRAEHRQIAEAIQSLLLENIPTLKECFEEE